jgi:hypothetical protein
MRPIRFAVIIMLLTLAATAHANLLEDGSFEYGDLGMFWNPSGNVGAFQIPGAYDGTWEVIFSRSQTPNNGQIYQEFATTPGSAYRLQFAYGVNGPAEQTLSVHVIGGNTILLDKAIQDHGRPLNFQLYNYTFLANSATTTLQFNDSSTVTNSTDIWLDAVSVVEISAEDLIHELIADVQHLVDLGLLSTAHGIALINDLDSALKKLDQGLTSAALDKLQAFIVQVSNFINDGELTATEGQPLIDKAQVIVGALASSLP